MINTLPNLRPSSTQDVNGFRATFIQSGRCNPTSYTKDFDRETGDCTITIQMQHHEGWDNYDYESKTYVHEISVTGGHRWIRIFEGGKVRWVPNPRPGNDGQVIFKWKTCIVTNPEDLHFDNDSDSEEPELPLLTVQFRILTILPAHQVELNHYFTDVPKNRGTYPNRWHETAGYFDQIMIRDGYYEGMLDF